MKKNFFVTTRKNCQAKRKGSRKLCRKKFWNKRKNFLVFNFSQWWLIFFFLCSVLISPYSVSWVEDFSMITDNKKFFSPFFSSLEKKIFVKNFVKDWDGQNKNAYQKMIFFASHESVVQVSPFLLLIFFPKFYRWQYTCWTWQIFYLMWCLKFSTQILKFFYLKSMKLCSFQRRRFFRNFWRK